MKSWKRYQFSIKLLLGDGLIIASVQQNTFRDDTRLYTATINGQKLMEEFLSESSAQIAVEEIIRNKLKTVIEELK